MVGTLDPRAGALHSFRPQTGAQRLAHAPHAKLDPARIAAETGAIAIHVTALLLLLAPLHPQVTPAPEEEVTPIIYEAAKPKPVQPLPPEVPIARPRPVPVPTPTITPPRVEPQPPPVVDAQPWDTPAEPQLASADIGVQPSMTEPLSGAHLEYLAAPPPPYPAQALRAGLTGTVLLRVLVDVEGRPIDVRVERSSGHRVLDAAARRHVLAKWRFKPAMQEGRAMQAIGLVPIDFTLDR